MVRLLFKFLIFLIVPGWALASLPLSDCQKILLGSTPENELRMQWERAKTLSIWQQERSFSPLPMFLVDRESVDIETLEPSELIGLEHFIDATERQVVWFKHPYNLDPSVPYFDREPEKLGVAEHLASRSIETLWNMRRIGIKMATNYPFGHSREHQPEKVRLDLDLKFAMVRSAHIADIDRKVGKDPGLVVQKELVSVVDRKTRNGYLIRDVDVLLDGYLYLPGHQIPYIGKNIARQFNSRFEIFWASFWAESLGRLQAKLLYRYALEVDRFNQQNFLSQMHKNSMPTGALVWRDIAESYLIEPLALALGYSHRVEYDRNAGWGLRTYFKYHDAGFADGFNRVRNGLTAGGFKLWREAQSRGFRNEMQSALGIVIPKNEDPAQFVSEQLDQGLNSELIQRILYWHKTNSSSD